MENPLPLKITKQDRFHFWISGKAALPGYLLLTFFPTWKYTDMIINVVCLFNAILYAFNMYDSFKRDKPKDITTLQNFRKTMKSFSTIDGVFNLFKHGNNSALLAAWIHYLCFDLLISKQIKDLALQTNNVPWPLVVLCFFSTLMFGPVGYGLFSALNFLFA